MKPIHKQPQRRASDLKRIGSFKVDKEFRNKLGKSLLAAEKFKVMKFECLTFALSGLLQTGGCVGCEEKECTLVEVNG